MIAFFCLIALSLAAGPAETWGHQGASPARDGIQLFTAPLKQTDGAKAVWTADAQVALNGGVAVACNVAVVSGRQGSIFGYDPKTGKQLWELDTGIDKSLNTAGINSDCVAFFSSDVGQVFAVTLGDGKKKWASPVLTKTTMPAACAVGPGTGNIFTADADGIIFSLDPSSGAVKWSANLTHGGYSPNVDGSLAVGLGLVFVGRSDGHLTALDETTGEVKWDYISMDLNPQYLATPTLADKDAIVVMSHDGHMYILDAASGNLRAGKVILSDIKNSVDRSSRVAFLPGVPVHGDVYIALAHDALYMVSKKTYKVVNKLTVGTTNGVHSPATGGPAVSQHGSFIFLALPNAKMMAFIVNAQGEMEKKWELLAPTPITDDGPIIYGNSIIAAGNQGDVFRVEFCDCNGNGLCNSFEVSVCFCHTGYDGPTCNTCANGFSGYPECVWGSGPSALTTEGVPPAGKVAIAMFVLLGGVAAASGGIWYVRRRARQQDSVPGRGGYGADDESSPFA